MRTLISLFLISVSLHLTANVKYIRFDKIQGIEQNRKHIDFLLLNEPLFNHWNQTWNYSISKNAVIKELKESYTAFLKLDQESIELKLLLGDIAHYLYNLEENSYNGMAIESYLTAIKIDSTDFRPYWFLASHYIMAANPDLSISAFKAAIKKLPDNEPSDFWEEYAYASAASNMPATCIYAMDMVRQIAGNPGNFETQTGKTIHTRLIEVNADLNYTAKDLWLAKFRRGITMTSRPLGILISCDSVWKLNMNDYKNHQTAFTLNPPRLKNQNGIQIGFTIMTIIKVSNGTESLDEFLQKILAGFNEKKKIDFPGRYDHIVAYEMKNKSIYPTYGGGHFLLVGLERSAPEHPGIEIEIPLVISGEKNSGFSYLATKPSIKRLEDKIMYILVLDSCDDIYPESSQIFKDWFEKKVIIE